MTGELSLYLLIAVEALNSLHRILFLSFDSLDRSDIWKYSRAILRQVFRRLPLLV
jgi:hypothetical protein